MTMTQSKRILGVIWFVGGLIPIVFLYVQDSYFEKYGAKGEEVWNWLLPTIVPTITLIIGVYAYDFYQSKDGKTGAEEKDGKAKKKERIIKADKFVFYLTLTISVFYLLFINSIIFLEPYSGDTIFDQISDSRKFWGTLQLLVNPLVGIFFVASGKNSG